MLILLLTVAAVLVGLSLVNTGIMTSEKIQLQNAADATAYSVSTVEARDLNFSAYTNRSMVANEVALGQMVGLMSHADMIGSVPSWLNVFFTTRGIYGIPFLGSFAQGTVNALRFPLALPEKAVKPVAKVISGFVYTFNKWVGTSQRAFNLGSLLFTGKTLWDVPGRNADNWQYAPFGYVTMAFHLLSHYPDFTNRKIFKTGPFISSYNQDKDKRGPPFIKPFAFADKATSSEQKAGMERLAALVNATRDPYSLHRQCTGNPTYGDNGLDICDATTGGWAVPVIPRFTIPLLPPINSKTVTLYARLTFGLDLRRHGGTDLRYKKIKNTQRFIWSASDQTGMDMTLKFDFKFRICLPLISCFNPLPTISQDFGGDAPFGVGGAQSSIAKNEIKGIFAQDNTMFLENFPPGGVVQDYFYGNSPDLLPAAWTIHNAVPWQMFIDFGALSPALAVQANNLFTGYEGLSRYNDSKRGADPIVIDKNVSFGWNSPYLIVSLEKDMDDISQSDSQGRFKLNHSAAAEKITVIAKSEVFFSRPNDLSYFRRSDGATELANAFNPYWDARLVDTSYIDRTTALAMNQQQLWLAQDFTAALASLQNLFKAIF